MNWFQREARSTPIGLPGGPCHVIRNIEESDLPEAYKQELRDQIERGKDLDNAEASALYDQASFDARIDLFQKVLIQAHAQYRMDQRGITVPEVQRAFQGFERWYTARMRPGRDMKPSDRRKLFDYERGDSVKFQDARTGLTIVFALDRGRRARLITTWWTDQPNPPRPRPGECEYVPYLDDPRDFQRPAILGSRRHRLAQAMPTSTYFYEQEDSHAIPPDYGKDEKPSTREDYPGGREYRPPTQDGDRVWPIARHAFELEEEIKHENGEEASLEEDLWDDEFWEDANSEKEAFKRRKRKHRDYKRERDYWRKNPAKYKKKLRTQRRRQRQNYRRTRTKQLRRRRQIKRSPGLTQERKRQKLQPGSGAKPRRPRSFPKTR